MGILPHFRSRFGHENKIPEPFILRAEIMGELLALTIIAFDEWPGVQSADSVSGTFAPAFRRILRAIRLAHFSPYRGERSRLRERFHVFRKPSPIRCRVLIALRVSCGRERWWFECGSAWVFSSGNFSRAFEISPGLSDCSSVESQVRASRFSS
jgi:hypothetical protein